MWETVQNVNITVKITIYMHTCIFYKPTPKPTHHLKLSAFLHFQSFCMIYKLVSSRDLKNIPIMLECTGITILVGTYGPHNTSTQTHTASVCILFSMIELLLYTVKGMSQLYPLYHLVYFLKCYVILLAFMLDNTFINNRQVKYHKYLFFEQNLHSICVNSIQFKFICIALFMMQVIAKQLYRKLSFYIIFSNSLSVVTVKLMSIWQKCFFFFLISIICLKSALYLSERNVTLSYYHNTVQTKQHVKQ